MKKLPIQSKPTRIWFLNQGCSKVPPGECGGKVLWAHPKGYFLNADGVVLKHDFSPAMRTPGRLCYNGKRGVVHPRMRKYGHALCHRLMAYAFATQPCPIFFSNSGKPYKGHVHHLIEEPENYRLDNLLFWLDRYQHNEADRRQRALREICPENNLHVFTYKRLARLQDPRRMSREKFETELARIKRSFEIVDHKLFTVILNMED